MQQYADILSILVKDIVNMFKNILTCRRNWLLKGSYDVISSFPFSLECYKLIVHRLDPLSCKD